MYHCKESSVSEYSQLSKFGWLVFLMVIVSGEAFPSDVDVPIIGPVEIPIEDIFYGDRSNITTLAVKTNTGEFSRQLLSVVAYPEIGVDLTIGKEPAVYTNVPVSWLGGYVCLQILGAEIDFLYSAIYKIPDVMSNDYSIGLSVESKSFQKTKSHEIRSIAMMLYKGRCNEAEFPFQVAPVSLLPLVRTKEVAIYANAFGGDMMYSWASKRRESRCKRVNHNISYSAACTIEFSEIDTKHEFTDMELITIRDVTEQGEYFTFRVYHQFLPFRP